MVMPFLHWLKLAIISLKKNCISKFLYLNHCLIQHDETNISIKRDFPDNFQSSIHDASMKGLG